MESSPRVLHTRLLYSQGLTIFVGYYVYNTRTGVETGEGEHMLTLNKSMTTYIVQA